MVRKITTKITGILAVMLLLLCGAAATASAESVYQGSISSSVVEIAEKVNISLFDDYVFYRSGQSEYSLLVGDLDVANGIYTLQGDGYLYKITQVNASGYSGSYYVCSMSVVSSYEVKTNFILVYSNIGGYPSLGNRSDVYSFVCMVLLVVFGVCALIRPLFNFVLRFRNGVSS